MSVSSQGNISGILWAIQDDGYNNSPPVLRAYDAGNLLSQLYNSSTANGGFDVSPGTAVKFSVPTIARGKVFMGSSNAVTVYGKLH